MSEQQKRHSPQGLNPPYTAFLVRCWREGEQWRFVLENVATRERLGFVNFEDLCLYIEKILKANHISPTQL